MLEVVNHLYDEELEDFRSHLKAILYGQAWLPINPPAWVVERQYNRREMAESLERFLAARRESIEWLSTTTAVSNGTAITRFMETLLPGVQADLRPQATT